MVATTSSIQMKTVTVTIQGMPPGLLMNSKRLMEADGGEGKKPKRTPEQEAELHCHWMPGKGKKHLALPWASLYKCICAAASEFKAKGRGTKRMTNLVAASISCDQDFISIGTSDYEVYQEWVRIPPRTGAMVKIARPRIRAWEATFTMMVDDEKYDVNMLREIIEEAGKTVGLGPWRPSLKGPYGKFVITAFKVG